MNEYVRNLDRIEFVVTMACTGKCIHCSEGEHSGFTGHIDADIAAEAVRKVCGHYRITSLMTFGGEALLFPEVVCAIHAAGTQMGILRRELITNGFFSKDAGRIREVAADLKAAGVNRLLLSVDAFHQETIPLEPVKLFAECVCGSGIDISLSPAWLVSREDGNPYNVRTREILQEFDGTGIPVGKGNIIFPEGNALKYLGAYLNENTPSDPYEEDPRDIRAISFSPEGDVLDGNVFKKDILDILNDYRPRD